MCVIVIAIIIELASSTHMYAHAHMRIYANFFSQESGCVYYPSCMLAALLLLTILHMFRTCQKHKY